jgi:hypothetical protein
MAALPPNPRPLSPLARAALFVREAFWVLALGVIACYAFFLALGAYGPGDVLGVSVAVGVLVVLWIVHAWAQGHRRAAGSDL